MTSPTNEQQRVDVLAVIRQACDRDALPYSVYVAAADLIKASNRTVRAFISLGVAQGVAATLQARQECEAALIAQEDALANVGAQA